MPKKMKIKYMDNIITKLLNVIFLYGPLNIKHIINISGIQPSIHDQK